MPKSYKPLSCSKTDIIELNKSASSTDDPRLALRAKIVLECAEGKQVKDIAADLQERPNTVILWRKRFEEHGLQGLLNLPRGKNAFRYGTDLKDRLFSLLDTQPPDGEARWTGNSFPGTCPYHRQLYGDFCGKRAYLFPTCLRQVRLLPAVKSRCNSLSGRSTR